MKVSYWPEIQKSGKYIDRRDLDGLQQFWTTRTKELEEDIFGLYRGRDWWAKQFGKKTGKDRIDLEFDLSKIKTMLSKTEEELRDQPWSYGRIFQNPKLAKVRLIGDVEETAFNYLKRVAWPKSNSVQNLREKNILPAVFTLMAGGDDTGFECEGVENSQYKQKYFKECEWKRENWKVKKVLKSTYLNSGGYWIPMKGGGASWGSQTKLNTQDKTKILNMDEVMKTGLLYEKCEEEHGWLSLEKYTDLTMPIRREVCDQIIRPWFGDTVSDKRLCLMEVNDFSYHLRLQTYLEMFKIPAWINKNTFWTKCSNYSI